MRLPHATGLSRLSQKAHKLLTAVGRFVRSIHTVVVAVAHPDSGNAAFGDGTLELVGGTRHLRWKTKGWVGQLLSFNTKQVGLCPLQRLAHIQAARQQWLLARL